MTLFNILISYFMTFFKISFYVFMTFFKILFFYRLIHLAQTANPITHVLLPALLFPPGLSVLPEAPSATSGLDNDIPLA